MNQSDKSQIEIIKPITQKEINNLPPPPQEWIDDIKLQEAKKSIETLEEYSWMDCYEMLNGLMELDIKELKDNIKWNKEHECYYKDMQIKQSRNGKITKKGLVKNLMINLYELDTQDISWVDNHLKKGIEYLVDDF